MHFLGSEDEFDAVLSMEIDDEESQSDLETEHTEAAMEIDDTLLESPEGPTITFFDLPEHVKIKILKYAGLIRPCLINIVFEKFRAKIDRGLCGTGDSAHMSRVSWTDSWVDPYRGTCDHPRLPVEVFLTSRAARRELGALFFAHNHFSIHLYSRAEFKIFCTATDWGLQHLRHLHLDLGPRETRYLKIAGGLHRTVMNMWLSFCRNCDERMPSLSCFSLKCRVRDLEVAYKVICAMNPFPTLSHCSFHFCNSQDDEIRRVLKRAAWRLTGNLERNPPFPFLKLPKEVQLLVLEQLLVKRSDPYLRASERAAGMVTFTDRKRHRTTSFPLSCCGTCSLLRAVCFCHARQTAFSTSCSCFSSPIPYFLVSREFYEDCRRVFFSKNLFLFVDEEPDSIMRFVNYIPTASFMQIRHLSFKFPLTYRAFNKSARTEEISMLSWSVLRRFIREHFDLPHLSLSVVDLGTKNGTPERNKYMRKLLKAFTDLRGLKEFRVFLADDPLFEKELERAVVGRASIGRFRPYNLPSIGNQDS